MKTLAIVMNLAVWIGLRPRVVYEEGQWWLRLGIWPDKKKT